MHQQYSTTIEPFGLPVENHSSQSGMLEYPQSFRSSFYVCTGDILVLVEAVPPFNCASHHSEDVLCHSPLHRLMCLRTNRHSSNVLVFAHADEETAKRPPLHPVGLTIASFNADR